MIPTAVGDITLTGAYTYNGKMYFDPQNQVQRPVINLFNATASWRASDAITLQLWGDNLSDEHYYAQTESQALFHYAYYPAPPRTYGFTVKYAYRLISASRLTWAAPTRARARPAARCA